MNVKKPDEQNEGSNDLNHLSDSDSTSTLQSGATVDHGLQMNNIDQVMHYLSEQIDSVLSACTERREFPMDIPLAKASVKSVSPAKRKLQAEGAQDLVYSGCISFRIAAALKRANKSAQLLKSTGSDTEIGDQCVEPTPKFIAEVLSSHLSNLASAIGLSIKACNGHINFYSADTQPQGDAIVGRPAVLKDSSTSSSSKERSLTNLGKFQARGQTLEIRLKRSSFDPEEHALYKKYQIKVHNDTPGHVTEFLQEVPS